MPRTMVKGLRLTPAELRRASRLRPFFPEAGTEADFTRLIYLRGLLLLEAEVAGAGGGAPPGQREADLAAIVLPRILAALQLLERAGRLPHPAGGPPPTTPGASAQGETVEPPIDPQAADDVSGLGGSEFL